jgi:hypothetical protein
MRGPTLYNSIKTAIPGRLWPFKLDENCDVLGARNFFVGFSIIGLWVMTRNAF